MILNSGEFDRKIIIQEQIKTSGDFNESLFTWQDWKTVWMSWKPISFRERFNSEKEITTEEGKLTGYYIKDLDPRMRILFDDKTWDIIGYAELGRKEKTELTIRRSV